MQGSAKTVAIPLRSYLTVLRRRPIEALEIAWWWITRRRLRARNRFGVVASSLPGHYRIWLAMHQAGVRRERSGRSGENETAFAVHIHVGSDQMASARVAIGSVLSQLSHGDILYISSVDPLLPDVLARATRRDDIHILPDRLPTRARALQSVLDLTVAAYLVPLDADAALTPGALAGHARAIHEFAGVHRVLYADQDERGAGDERTNPWLKPAWDEDLFLAQDYLSAACALPVAAALSVGIEPSWPDDIAVYALLDRLLHAPEAQAPRHVPFVAVTTAARAWCRPSRARRELVHAAIDLPISDGPFGTLIVHRPLPNPLPLVSVIVPTRDRLDLLEPCVAGILHATDYPNLDLIIADNDSVEPGTLSYLEGIARDRRVTVVRWPHPYNYSAINNFAVTQASGAYLCLLNNDTEVVDPTWLRAMMAHAVRPEVGAVGARLLYPDRSIQHAGVVVGMGGAAGHAHRGLAEGQAGWFAHALVTRGVTAITGACVVVSKEKFVSVGGLDEQSLAIAYNDIDLCLKLRAAGWRNIYAAEAVVMHHEGKSRGLDFSPEHLARYLGELAVFRERWGTIGFADPMHHPGLDPASETYRLQL